MLDMSKSGGRTLETQWIATTPRNSGVEVGACDNESVGLPRTRANHDSVWVIVDRV